VLLNELKKKKILSLEYHRYLKEVVNILETDPAFKRMIENASVDEIKSGRIAQHLEFVNHNVRTKLDELKRKEIDRLRDLIMRRAKLSNLGPTDIENMLPKHLDHNNIETLEIRFIID
jgi:nucleobindin